MMFPCEGGDGEILLVDLKREGEPGDPGDRDRGEVGILG
jgi:hypothetical protein